MPKSRRDRKIALSKTQKKIGLETKQAMVDKIRGAVDEYPRLFVFSVDNMRNTHFKHIREEWASHSKFFMGKNRVMALALGRTEAEEYNDKLHCVSKLLKNQRGLLFTSQNEDKVLEFFDEHSENDFLRTGGIAEDTVILEQGPLTQFSHAIEPQLRALGMPTELKKGVVTLLQEYTVCKEGDRLTSEQARILKLLGHQQAKFKLNMIALWSRQEGEFKMLKEASEMEEDNEDEEDDEDENQSE
eukprot:00876.XXX_1008_63_1 [CDS] Oithona nana genome sequencing.